MNPFPFLLGLHLLVVLSWGYYELLNVVIGGRWRPDTVVAFVVVSLIFVVVIARFGIAPDAFACSDQAEILIEAVPGPGALGGTVEARDFFNCSLYWFT